MLHRKKKSDSSQEWDDGRTIASMNIDGMPWYDQRPNSPSANSPKRPEEQIPDSGEQLSGRDLRKVIISATMIGLGVALVFVIAAFLLIQLMLLLWT